MRRQPPQSLVEFLAMNPPEGMPGQQDPIPPWLSRLQPAIQDRMGIQRAERPAPAPFAYGPGAVMPPMPLAPFEGPPAARGGLRAFTGEQPGGGGVEDWLAPPAPLPAQSKLVQPSDPEPWRSPTTTDRMEMGGPARMGGLEPPSAAWRDDDVAFEQALERARAAIGQQRTVNNMAIGPAGRLTGMAPRRGVYGPIKRR